MLRLARLLRLLIAALALSFVVGSATAGVQCATPMGMPAGCPDTHKAHDCALACAPMCAAIKPMPAQVAQPIAPMPVFSAVTTAALPTCHIGPELPPPRAG